MTANRMAIQLMQIMNHKLSELIFIIIVIFIFAVFII